MASTAGVVASTVSALGPVLQTINVGLSAYSAIKTGNIAGFAGGLVGGAVFGAIGQGFALGMASSIGMGVLNGGVAGFLGGAIAGAAEFGLAGFGAGFGAALASGESLSNSFRAGGHSAAMGAVAGAIIQGSYMAGWQDTFHGFSRDRLRGNATLDVGAGGGGGGGGRADAARSPASAPVGRKGAEFKEFFSGSSRNSPATIGGRSYSAHALDQMQNRGIIPSVVEETMTYGIRSSGNRLNTTVHYDPQNNVMVVIDSKTSKVITVRYGEP